MKKGFVGIGLVIVGCLILLVYSIRNIRGSSDSVLLEPYKIKGNPEAPHALVVFSDFECPFCDEIRHTVEQLLETYPDKLKIMFKHFPLSSHEYAAQAAEAAECAAEQGKFWPYHDMLFNKAVEWSNSADVSPFFAKYAKELGLDTVHFQHCVNSGIKKLIVKNNQKEGRKFFVSGTPTLLLDGTKVMTRHSLDYLKKEIEMAFQREAKI